MSREFRVLLPSWIQALPEWAKALWHSRWLERVILPRALEGEDPSRFLSGETCIVNLLVSHAHSLVLLSWLSLSLSQCLLSLSPPSRSHFKHASLQASTPLFLLLISSFKHQDLGARHDHNGHEGSRGHPRCMRAGLAWEPDNVFVSSFCFVKTGITAEWKNW